MSITDELREWAVNHRAELNAGQLYPAMIEAIADRIDAEHEKAVHRKPDSWEDIISDAVILGRQLEWADNSRGDADSERELVERCRRLAGR